MVYCNNTCVLGMRRVLETLPNDIREHPNTRTPARTLARTHLRIYPNHTVTQPCCDTTHSNSSLTLPTISFWCITSHNGTYNPPKFSQLPRLAGMVPLRPLLYRYLA